MGGTLHQAPARCWPLQQQGQLGAVWQLQQRGQLGAVQLGVEEHGMGNCSAGAVSCS